MWGCIQTDFGCFLYVLTFTVISFPRKVHLKPNKLKIGLIQQTNKSAWTVRIVQKPKVVAYTHIRTLRIDLRTELLGTISLVSPTGGGITIKEITKAKYTTLGNLSVYIGALVIRDAVSSAWHESHDTWWRHLSTHVTSLFALYINLV